VGKITFLGNGLGRHKAFLCQETSELFAAYPVNQCNQNLLNIVYSTVLRVSITLLLKERIFSPCQGI
jgi:hypothetical protein